VEDRHGPQSQNGFTFVINSMHLESQAQFRPKDSRLKGAFIFFDEFDQVLDALFNDSTMEHRRALIASTLAKTIQNVITSGGTCVFASADLYEYHKEFVNDIFKQAYGFEPKSYTLVNDYNPVAKAGCELGLYDDPTFDESPARLYADTVDLIKEGCKILLQTTSQSVESPYGTKTLEADLKKRFSELQVLRWDSETNCDPNHEAFGFAEKLANDPTIIENYDAIIMSPVAEAGIDIKDPNEHFDYNVGIFNSGNQDTRAIRQTLRRLRQLVTRKVFIASRSNSKIGTGADTPLGLLRDNSRQVAKLKSVLLSAGVVEDADEFDLGDGHDFQIFLRPWAYSAALKNADFADYRKAAREALEADGFFVESATDLKEMIGFSPASAADTKEQLQQTRDDNKEARYNAIINKPDPGDDRYEQLQNKNDKTADEQIEQEKGFLSRAYNIEVSYRLVEKHNEGRKDWLQKLKLHYHLTAGAEFLPEKERATLQSLTEGTGHAFSPEAVRKSKALKIHRLKEFGIDRFLDKSSHFDDGLCSDTEFTEDDLKAWYDSIIGKAQALKQSLGISIWGKNKAGQWEKVQPKTLADRLLGLIDLSLETSRRRNENSDRVRVYQVRRVSKPKDSDLLELKSKIFAAWLEKDQRGESNHSNSGAVPKSPYNITTIEDSHHQIKDYGGRF